MTEPRIAKLEAHTEHVLKDMDDVKALMHQNAEQLSELTSTVKMLVVVTEEISKVRERMHKIANKVQIGVNAYEVGKRAHARIDTNDKKLELIQAELPTLKMAGGWVFKGVIGVIGLLAAASFTLILKTGGAG